jgi:hypothetical protein
MIVINTFIKDKKFEGFLLGSDDGETKYLTIEEYQNYIQNSGKKILVRFPNESNYEEANLNLEKFEISNEFEHEYFGWYDNTAIALKKSII